MPRWLTLPAANVTALLVFAACSAPLGALELNYQPPEPSIAPSPKPVAPPGRPQGGETADYRQRHATRTVFASISNAIIRAAASRAPNLIPPMRAR